MIAYFKAEFYRIVSKKSLYVFFGVLMVLYIIITFVRAGYQTQDSIVSEADLIFTMLTIFGGTYIFSSVYNDDIHAKSMVSVLGAGMRKPGVAITKLILSILVNLLAFAMAFIVLCVIFSILGFPPTAGNLQQMLPIAGMNLLLVLGYSAIAGTVMYATRKTSISLAVFVLLASRFIAQIVSMLLGLDFIVSAVGDLSGYLLTASAGIMTSNFTATALVTYLLYIAVFTALSLYAFHKKELDI